MEFTGVTAIALRYSLTPLTLSKGDQDEISIDRRRRCCRGSFRNPCPGAGCYRRPRLLRAVLPRRQLSKSGTGQSIYRWRFPAVRERYGVRPHDAVDRARGVPLSRRTEVKRLTIRA